MKAAFSTTISSPIGRLRLCASETGLTHVLHENQHSGETEEAAEHPHLALAVAQLREYFEGKREVFDVPLAPEGTAFQMDVWEALRTIPYGETLSYADIAEQIGRPKAVRAVGAANGRNPLSIFVPCHRVIGKNGSLTGYAGGLTQKSVLLEIEQADQLLPSMR
jgi:methylated-DNA-[protein]-cysteine S-methyltransferase